MANQPKLLLIGPPNDLIQNITYAMPARQTKGYTSVNTTTALEVSSIVDSGFIDITPTNGEFQTTAPFIRATTTGVTVFLKAL